MGFWDLHVGDLEAMGITVGEMDLKCLEQGGAVLHLQQMPHPESSHYRTEGFWETSGEPLLVMEVLKTFPPNVPLIDPHYWSQENPGVTPYELVCNEWGADVATFYPSYFGILEEYDRYSVGWSTNSVYWRGETIIPYRFWTCAPLIDESVVEPLRTACDQRMSDGGYYDLCAVVDLERSDDYWIEANNVWLFYNDRGKLPGEEEKRVEEWLAFMDGQEWDIRLILEALERLVENEHWPPPWVPPAQWGSLDLKPLEFKPMDEYLADEPLALSVWKSMTRWRKFVIGRLTAHMTDYEKHSFSLREGDWM